MKKKLLVGLATGLFVLGIVGMANSTVVINDFSITESNLSFSVNGTVSAMGSKYQHQLMFGLVDDITTDWINSFSGTSSTWLQGASHAVTTNYLYDLSGSWGDSLLTTSLSNYQIGDQIDIAFNFVGDFNLTNFNINNFGMSVGLNGDGNIPPSSLNLVKAVNLSAPVPEPATMLLFGTGLVGLVVSRVRRKKKA